ncbi:MAG: MerR family transcriptional regulator [Bacillota bacterium]
MKGLTISQVAKVAKVNLETVRYYEKRGLISEPPRTESGYRRFPEEVIERIIFIKRAQELGFTLEEIKQLLWMSEREKDANKVKVFTTHKIEEIEAKIHDLISMKQTLKQLADQCEGSGFSMDQCPIIKAFNEGE